MNRRQFLALSAASATIGTVACRRSPASSGSTSTSAPAVAALPQALLVDAGGRGRFGAYLEELLGVEGLVAIRRIDPAIEAPAVLATVPSAIVYGTGLSTPWIEALNDFVIRGGTLAAVDPDSTLLARFGVEDAGPLAADGVAGVRLTAMPDPEPLRLHVDGRRWTASSATVTARFQIAGGDTTAPAALRISHGAGSVLCWAFDLALNVAFIRQGDPQSVNAERDGWPEIRFVDVMLGWVRPDVLERPDADLYVRALVSGLAAGSSTAAGPLLGVNFFPSGAASVFVCTGDAHGVGAGVLDQVLRRVEAGGARTTVYYEPPETSGWRRYARSLRWSAASLPLIGPRLESEFAPPSPRVVEEWRARGHEFCPHPTAVPDLETGLVNAWGRFEEDGYGTSHASTRTHAVLWKDWVSNPRSQRAYGVRMNLDVYQVGPVMRRSDGSWSHGHLVGSGFPARFVEQNGDVIDCYQQPTQVLDEQFLAVVGGPEGLSGAGSAAVAAEQLAHALTITPAALCGVFHIDSFVPAVGRGVEAGAFLDGMLAVFRDAGVPIWPVGRWLRFLDGRRDTAVASRSWDARQLRLSCVLAVSDAAAPGVEILVPTVLGNAVLDGVTVDGTPLTLQNVSRIEHTWARCTLSPGRVQLVAQYRRA